MVVLVRGLRVLMPFFKGYILAVHTLHNLYTEIEVF